MELVKCQSHHTLRWSLLVFLSEIVIYKTFTIENLMAHMAVILYYTYTVHVARRTASFCTVQGRIVSVAYVMNTVYQY